MGLTAGQQKRALNEFMAGIERDHIAASNAVVRQAAIGLKAKTVRQLGSNFNSSSNGFKRGVKIYNLKADNNRGPASYVRLGKIQSQFQEATTLTGRNGRLVILLPAGAANGFRRISKGNTWAQVFARWQKQLVFKKVGDGTIVLYKKEGRVVPIYKFQTSVRTSKRLTFLEDAELVGQDMPAEIDRLLRSTDG